MNGPISGRQLAMGLSMLYAGLIGAMAVINQSQAMLVIILVGGPIVAWAWWVSSRKK